MKDYKYLEAKNAIQRLAIASEIWRDIRNPQSDINDLTDEQLDELTRPEGPI